MKQTSFVLSDDIKGYDLEDKANVYCCINDVITVFYFYSIFDTANN